MVSSNQNQFLIGLVGSSNQDKINILKFFSIYDSRLSNDIFNINLNKDIAFFKYENYESKYILADLPKTTFLISPEKNSVIVRDFLCFNNPNAVIVVSNINNLDLNLNLLFQIMEITDNIILCIDEISSSTSHINIIELELLLGIPVFLTSNINLIGIDNLLNTIKFTSYNTNLNSNKLLFECNIENVVNSFSYDLKNVLPSINPRWMALRIIDNDKVFFDSLSNYVDDLTLSKIENIKQQFPKILNHENIKSNFIKKNILKSSELKNKVCIINSDNSLNKTNFIFNIFILNILVVFIIILSFLYFYIKG